MKVRQGPKGKYFTDVVRKMPLRVAIQTAEGLITGEIHIHPDRRTLDELNQADEFIAVTKAVVESNGDSFETDFLALNKSQIVWVHPLVDQVKQDD